MDFQEYLKNLKSTIESHPNKDELKKRIIIGDDSVFFVNNILTEDEIADLTNEEQFYYPVCTKEEIKRIFNVQNNADYLLRLRADSIADHARYHRVFLQRFNQNKKNWSLSKYFSQIEFDNYLESLSNTKRERCKKITYGYAFLDEPNGKCLKTKYGELIIISESLRYYLFYMNLFLLAPHYDISQPDDFYSLIISLRIMMYSEALDFDLDPRGELPETIEKEITTIVNLQLEYIIGHEFAHYLLGHLDKNLLTDYKFSGVPNIPTDTKSKYYKNSWEQEFEADYHSIAMPNYPIEIKTNIVNSAYLFFEGLHLLEAVRNYVNPSPSKYHSHPKALDRLWSLKKSVGKKFGYSSKQIKNALKSIYNIEEYLSKEFLPFSIEQLEVYGSVYLPNYRKNIKVDRIDY